jgi:hypothetical protein
MEGLGEREGGGGKQAGVVEDLVQQSAKTGGNQGFRRVARFHQSRWKMRRAGAKGTATTSGMDGGTGDRSG